ncbi:hypothetical protein E1263_29845 [Kribbella antibiotica]|uniref:Uncharacterized protein n=1 Tax=Kribbella antibiotica TaxID=190195 RepID=A0A4R4Z1P1_9ACTN|nr:hypothetical protein [Kribbella antibiotica]TDD51773.1 hypothetical protein E1263_29845 [Kribbella antibiotica]
MDSTSRPSVVKAIATRLGIAVTTGAVLVAANAGLAHAAGMSWSGDFSNRSTAMKRLANCAASDWYNNSRSGGQITTCNDAAGNSYWDGIHLAAADYHGIEGKRVAYRSDQSCPPKDGFQYVKCFYVNGKAKGHPVMTVAIESYGLGGQDVNVSWYYL